MTERNKMDPSSMPKLHDLTNQFDPVKHKVRSFKYKLAATPQNIKGAKLMQQLFKSLFHQRWPRR